MAGIDPPPEQPKVSPIVRVLAWVFVICINLALVSLIIVPKGGDVSSLSTAEIVLGAIGALLFGPVIFIVAFTGRPPRWWGHFDEALDIDKALNRYAKKRDYKK